RRLIEHLDHPKSHNSSGQRTFYEGTLHGLPAVLVMSRWGKVAASSTATQLIVQHKVDALIFTGVAGGIKPMLGVGDIVIADRLVQHDMDATPFFERFEVPMLGKKEFMVDHTLSQGLFDAATHFITHTLGHHVSPQVLNQFAITHPKVVRGLVASGD